MRINFFSVLLILLICASVGKVLHSFDRLMVNYAKIQTNTSSFVAVSSATAADKPKKPTNKDGEELKVGDEDDKGHIVNEKGELKDKILPDAKNLLDFSLSGSEVTLLKELQKRSDQLDNFEKKLNLKESVLKNTEHQLTIKIAEIKEMQDRVNGLIEKLSSKNNVRIKSLAKIYENMKPSEAAKIFNDLEMTVLLEIIRSMRETKVGPIIAQMDPIKAREISLEFARINEEIIQVKK